MTPNKKIKKGRIWPLIVIVIIINLLAAYCFCCTEPDTPSRTVAGVLLCLVIVAMVPIAIFS